jgi:glycosyltransferase involved in cell wall biosynthesis
MKVLVIASMFPNPAHNNFGIFVYRRISQVLPFSDLTVINPIPYFPGVSWTERYRHRKLIPYNDIIGAIQVNRPRFFSIPRFFKQFDPISMAISIKKWITSNSLSFDLIDSHLGWPDGYAAYLLSKKLKIPYTITLRGHDINEIPLVPNRRHQLVTALGNAARVMSVADALRREAVTLGCPEERTETIPNGVEIDLFFPGSRVEARERLQLPLTKRIILSVGNLNRRKGYHLVMEAINLLKNQGVADLYYVIVGGGGEEGDMFRMLVAHREQLGLQDEVFFAGNQPNDHLREWYVASDFTCLASDKEGWANVLLESLACGRPVVATNVWGTPEVIRSPEYGVLIERTPEAIAQGILTALRTTWHESVMVQYAARFSWKDVGRRVYGNYEKAVKSGIVAV